MTVSVRGGEEVLDDVERLERADPGRMLRAVASSAAQVREAAILAEESGVAAVAAEGRPRAVLVLGMGGSGTAGDLLAAVAGPGSPMPVLIHKGYGLPGWVGIADLVIAVSSSGTTEETLSGLEEACRRGCRVVGVGRAGSPLAALAEQARAPFVPVPQGRMPRASLWALSVPVLLAGHALGLAHADAAVLEATARRLEEVSVACRPASEAFVNPAKALALELAGTLPLVWGSSPLAGAAAYRMSCQLAENAKYPSIHGVLPEANHNQVVTLDGPFGALGRDDPDELFRDRAEEDGPVRLRLVMLRDDPGEEHPQMTRRAEASTALARERGVPVTELVPEGASRLERLASLVGLVDYASVYLGIALGADPTPIAAIQDLKERIAV